MIQTTTFNGAPPAWLAAKLTGKKVVLTVHEVWINKWQKITEMGKLGCMIHNFLERLIYLLKYDKYVCVSNSTKNDLLRIGIEQKKVETIYNGIDYDFWNPEKYDGEKVREKLGLKDKFVYLFHGRPGISKGLEYLIRAVPLISKKLPNSKLLAIISKDPAYAKNYQNILALITKLKIKDRVIVHEPVPYPQLPNFIKSADCVVVPSLAEGFGFSAAEACTMQVPVIASNTTSLPEVVSGKFVLVEPKNPQLIAEAVWKVSQGKFEQNELKMFNLDANVNNYIETYRNLITY